MKTLDQIINDLPANRREKVLARGQHLVAEEMALRHVRHARHLTQQSMATILGVGQDQISKIENRSDMLLSTLRTYVEAMGGSLRLVAEFPDGVAILSSLGEISEATEEDRPSPSPQPRKRAKPRRRLELAHTND